MSSQDNLIASAMQRQARYLRSGNPKHLVIAADLWRRAGREQQSHRLLLIAADRYVAVGQSFQGQALLREIAGRKRELSDVARARLAELPASHRAKIKEASGYDGSSCFFCGTRTALMASPTVRTCQRCRNLAQQIIGDYRSEVETVRTAPDIEFQCEGCGSRNDGRKFIGGLGGALCESCIDQLSDAEAL